MFCQLHSMAVLWSAPTPEMDSVENVMWQNVHLFFSFGLRNLQFRFPDGLAYDGEAPNPAV